jgi:hypothetical protein
MADEPENLVFEQLTALRGEVQALRNEMRDGFGLEVEPIIARLDETLCLLALALSITRAASNISWNSSAWSGLTCSRSA